MNNFFAHSFALGQIDFGICMCLWLYWKHSFRTLGAKFKSIYNVYCVCSVSICIHTFYKCVYSILCRYTNAHTFRKKSHVHMNTSNHNTHTYVYLYMCVCVSIHICTSIRSMCITYAPILLQNSQKNKSENVVFFCDLSEIGWTNVWNIKK